MADVAEVVKLRPLPLLHGLVLADCPISEMDDYRLEVDPHTTHTLFSGNFYTYYICM